MQSNKFYIGNKLVNQFGFGQADTTNCYNKIYLGDKEISSNIEELTISSYSKGSPNTSVVKDKILITPEDRDTYFRINFPTDLSIKQGDKFLIVLNASYTGGTTNSGGFNIAQITTEGSIQINQGLSQYIITAKKDYNLNYFTFDDSSRFLADSPVYVSVQVFQIVHAHNKVYIGNNEITPSYSDNLLLDSDVEIETTNYIIASYTNTEYDKLQIGEELTATIWGEFDESIKSIGLYNTVSNSNIMSLYRNGNTFTGTGTWNIFPGSEESNQIRLYQFSTNYPSSQGVSHFPAKISKVKLERGHNSNPIWTPNVGNIHNLIKNSEMIYYSASSNTTAVQKSLDSGVSLKKGDFITITMEDVEKTVGQGTAFGLGIYDYTQNINVVKNSSIPLSTRICTLEVTTDYVPENNVKVNIFPFSTGSAGSTREDIKITKLMITKGVQPHVWKPAKSEINNG